MGIVRRPRFEGMGAHAEPEHRLALPVARIVSGAQTAARMARDLVAVVARVAEPGLDVLDQIGREILVAGLHPAARQRPPEGRLGLEREFVGRYMLGAKREQRVDVAVERRATLVREREDQIEGDIFEAGATRRAERVMNDRCAMRSSQALQSVVLEGLNTDRQTVDARFTKPGKPRELDRARVQLDRGLGGFFQPIHGPGPGKGGANRIDQTRDRRRPEQSRSSPSEIEAGEAATREIRPAGREFPAKGVHILPLDRGRELPGRHDGEIAIGTDPLAERQMDVHTHPPVVESSCANGNGRGRRHFERHFERVPAPGGSRAMPDRLR